MSSTISKLFEKGEQTVNIKGLSLGDLGTNGYIIFKNNKALMIDPGGDAERLIYYLKQNDLQIIAILLTHAHFDHIGALDDVRDKYHAPVYLHDSEANWLADPSLNGSSIFPVSEVRCKPVDYYLQPGNMVIDSFEFNVIHTPGHSPGGISFVFDSEKFVVSGDCLFQNGIGRTDLPGGNQQELMNSIKQKLLQLPEDYTVYPGHGPKTTIKREKQMNPFL